MKKRIGLLSRAALSRLVSNMIRSIKLIGIFFIKSFFIKSALPVEVKGFANLLFGRCLVDADVSDAAQ